ncbi:MAG: farnesyl diphosphate synthase [Methylophilaceae bacterium]
MSKSLDPWITLHQKRIEDFLKEFINKNSDETLIKKVCEYAIFNGGKRFRALLAYAIGEINGVNKQALDYVAGAVEVIHCYSLIHDDLPAMDDDSLRRGKPSCHIKFNEAQAILAGDGLQVISFNLLCSSDLDISNKKKLGLLKILSKAIGIQGMVLGQSLDMEASNNTINLKSLEHLQELKTGALIEASCTMPYSISDVFIQNNQNKISKMAKLLGKIYQITDDILDNESSENILGKTCGKDKNYNKATFISLIGLEEAKKINLEFFEKAMMTLEGVSGNTKTIKQLITKIYQRKF